jgi:hypothetical protein
MSDFGHAIGLPAEGGAGQAQQTYEPYRPYGYDQPTPQEHDLGAVHAQARARAETGDLTGARTMIEESLAAGELRLGPQHPALVPLMVDLATIARRLGNLTETRNQLRRAYGIVLAVSGSEHPTALSIEGRLAAVGYRLGEPTQDQDRHLADAGARVLGPDHPAVRGAQQRLGLGGAPASAPASVAAPAAPAAPVAPVPTAPPAAASPYVAAATYGPPQPPVAAALPVVLAPSHALEGDLLPARVDEPTARVRPARTGNRGLVLVLCLAALVLAGAGIAAMQLFFSKGGLLAGDPVTGTSTEPTPTVEAPPAPTGIRLNDRGDTVTVSWADPSGGQVPFVVSVGIEDNALFIVESVPAGQTTVTIYATNPNFQYCFTVAAVWSADLVRESERTCTTRILPSTTSG